MATAYFGYGVNSDGSVNGTPSADAGYGNGFTFSFWINPAFLGDANYITWFACPGSGSQDVVDISMYLNETSDGAIGQIAVYSAAGNLMARGTNSFGLAAGPSWQGHLTQGEITQLSALTPGDRYVIFASFKSTGIYSIYTNNLTADNNTNFANHTDYVGAIPGTLPSNTDSGSPVMMRVGVQAAVGAISSQIPYRDW